MNSTGLKAGFAEALAVAGPGSVPPAQAADQLALFPAPVAAEWTPLAVRTVAQKPVDRPSGVGGAPGDGTAAGGAVVVTGQGNRGGGRPVGSRNRRTNEMLDYLLIGRGLKPPLQFLLEVVAMDGQALAGRGVHPDDQLKVQVAAASAALPYVHQKLPPAPDTGGKTASPILLGDLTDDAMEQAADMGLGLAIGADGRLTAQPDASDAEVLGDDASEGGGDGG